MPTHWNISPALRKLVPQSLPPRFDRAHMQQYLGINNTGGVLYEWTRNSASIRLFHEGSTRVRAAKLPDPIRIVDRRISDFFPQARRETEIYRMDGACLLEEFNLLLSNFEQSRKQGFAFRSLQRN